MAKAKYDHAHRELRKDWKRRIDGGEIVHCHHYPECREPDTRLYPFKPFDLEHHPITGVTLGPGHRRCNRGTSRQWMEIATKPEAEYQWFT